MAQRSRALPAGYLQSDASPQLFAEWSRLPARTNPLPSRSPRRLTLLPFTLWDTCHWGMLPVTGLVAFLLLGEPPGTKGPPWRGYGAAWTAGRPGPRRCCAAAPQPGQPACTLLPCGVAATRFSDIEMALVVAEQSRSDHAAWTCTRSCLAHAKLLRCFRCCRHQGDWRCGRGALHHPAVSALLGAAEDGAGGALNQTPPAVSG